MPANRTDPRAGLADAAAKEHEVAQQANVLDARRMLRQSHPVGEDRRVRMCVDVGGDFEVVLAQAGTALDLLPGQAANRGRELLIAAGMLVNELMIED